MVSSETMVQNFQTLSDKIFTQLRGTSRITGGLRKPRSERPPGHDSGECGHGKPGKDLQALGFLLGQVGKPRIMILVAEQQIGQQYYNYWWGTHRGTQTDLNVAENTIMDRFREKGSTSWTPRPRRGASKFPRLSGSGTLRPERRHPGKAGGRGNRHRGESHGPGGGEHRRNSMKSLQANISMRAIQVDNARVLSSGTENAAAVHIDEVTGGWRPSKRPASRCPTR